MKIVSKSLKILIFTIPFFIYISDVNSVTDFAIKNENKRKIIENFLRPDIIGRAEWGADESYRYLDSQSWLTILEKRTKSALIQLSENQKNAVKIAKEREESMNDYINTFFLADNTITSKHTYDSVHRLAWPIQKTDYVKSIIVHHTHSEYSDPKVGMNEIYKYHAVSRQWGDIGYNYVIGADGKIYEGRVGGSYTIGAHAIWNNRSTVGIALMGDYDKKPISTKQYDSLKKLIRYLAFKYGINFNDTYSYHKECIGQTCLQPLITNDNYTLSGHRDAGHTTCPGDQLYKTLDIIRNSLANETKYYTPIKRKEN